MAACSAQTYCTSVPFYQTKGLTSPPVDKLKSDNCTNFYLHRTINYISYLYVCDVCWNLNVVWTSNWFYNLFNLVDVIGRTQWRWTLLIVELNRLEEQVTCIYYKHYYSIMYIYVYFCFWSVLVFTEAPSKCLIIILRYL